MKIGKKKYLFMQPANTSVDHAYDFVDVINEETHDDLTNVNTWHFLIANNKSAKDYSWMRQFAKNEFLPNWFFLNFEEKQILATYLIYPASLSQEEYDLLIPVELQQKNCAAVAIGTRISRERRWEAARSIMSVLSVADSIDIYLTTEDISDRYMKANFPHLLNWINSTAYAPFGIDYTTTGFASKSYYNENLKIQLNDILINGNY